jgi:hypothetical protein
MVATKKNSDLSTLQDLSTRFEKYSDYMLSDMSDHVMRLTAETRVAVRERLDRTAKEIAEIPLKSGLNPFLGFTSPESQVLILIMETGYTPFGVSVPHERMHNIFFGDQRIVIRQHDLPEEFEHASEKFHITDVLYTLKKLGLVDCYEEGGDECKSGHSTVELTQLGKRLAEILQERKKESLDVKSQLRRKDPAG